MSSTRKLEPLRYRIDPTQKKLDELDKLESELFAQRNSMEEDEFYALHCAILKRRHKIAPESSCEAPTSDFSSSELLWQRVALECNTPRFKVVLTCLVCVWIFLKYFHSPA